jgi:hypothetical protein
MAIHKFLIERAIPAIGSAEPREFEAIVRTSNAILEPLRPKVQWVQSYIAADKTFCLFLAESEETLRRYIEKSDFPADKITQITRVIDPSTSDS